MSFSLILFTSLLTVTSMSLKSCHSDLPAAGYFVLRLHGVRVESASWQFVLPTYLIRHKCGVEMIKAGIFFHQQARNS